MLVLLAVAASVGCKSQAEKECDKLVKQSEVSLLSMNPTDEASVTATLGELKEALSACRAAKSPEVSEIEEGLKNVEHHLRRLESGEVKPPPPPPGAEELSDLEKNGDPGCPRGQAYQHPILKKQILCKGPLMIEHNYEQVVEYFQKHRVEAAKKDAMLRGAQAGVAYTFKFDQVESKQGPLCLTLDAPKEKKPEELIAFATNVPIAKIDVTKPTLLVDDQEVAVKVTTGESGTSVVLGNCEGTQPMLLREEPVPGAHPEGAKEAAANRDAAEKAKRDSAEVEPTDAADATN